MLIARWIWLLLLIAALAALLYRGRLRVVPWFGLYLAAALAQTAAHFSNMDFRSSWWPTWTAVMVVLRSAAAVEVFWRRARRAHRPALWCIGLAGIPAGVTVIAARLRPDVWHFRAAQLLRHFEVALLAFVLLSMYVTWLIERQSGFVRWHAWLYAALIGNQVAGLLLYESLPPGFSAADWNHVMTLTYCGAALCYAGWIILAFAAPTYRRDLPTLPSRGGDR